MKNSVIPFAPFALLLCAALVGAQTANAQTAYPRHHLKGEYKHILRHLHLSRAEKSEIRPVQRSQRLQIADVRRDHALTPGERRHEIHAIQRSTIDQIRTDLSPAQRRRLNHRLADRSAHGRAGY